MNRPVIWILFIAVCLAMASNQTKRAETTAPAKTPASVQAELTARSADDKPVLQTTTAPGNRNLTMIGDSLTVGTNSYVLKSTHGFNWNLDGKSGRTLKEAKPLIAAAAPKTDVFVIALGTNDCASPVTDSELERRIFTAMSATDGLPTSFVTLGERGKIAECATRFNKLVRSIAATIPTMTVLDWQTYLGDRINVYEQDDIHLTADGYRERAGWFLSYFHTGA